MEITRNKAIKTIYAISKEQNISNELLHQMIYNHFNITSIANSDSSQLQKILSLLGVNDVKVMVNSQIYMIYKKAEEWNISKEMVDAFVQKRFKKSSVYALDTKLLRGLVKVVNTMAEKKKKEWMKENNIILFRGSMHNILYSEYEDGSLCIVLKDYVTSKSFPVGIHYDHADKDDFALDIVRYEDLFEILENSGLFHYNKNVIINNETYPLFTRAKNDGGKNG